MIDGRHPEATLFHPLAVLAGDAVVRVKEPFGGNPAQTDDDFRLHQRHLTAQIADAGILLRLQRIPVVGWAALDNVADIAVFLPGKVDDGQHVVQQLSGGADEGLAPQILLLAGALPHKQDICSFIAYAEDHIVPGLAQAAACAAAARHFQFLPGQHQLLLLRCALLFRRRARIRVRI